MSARLGHRQLEPSSDRDCPTTLVAIVNCELKAEYDFSGVLMWHIVPAGAFMPLCGTPLAPAAETRPIPFSADLDNLCHLCAILYAAEPKPQQAASP